MTSAGAQLRSTRMVCLVCLLAGATRGGQCLDLTTPPTPPPPPTTTTTTTEQRQFPAMMPAHLPRHPPRDDLPHQHTKSKNICRLGGLASAHQLGRLVAESSPHCRTQMGCSSSSCLHQPATWTWAQAQDASTPVWCPVLAAPNKLRWQQLVLLMTDGHPMLESCQTKAPTAFSARSPPPGPPAPGPRVDAFMKAHYNEVHDSREKQHGQSASTRHQRNASSQGGLPPPGADTTQLQLFKLLTWADQTLPS